MRWGDDDFEAKHPGFTLAITLAITLVITLAIQGTKQHAFRLLTNATVALEAELIGRYKMPWECRWTGNRDS